MKRFPNKKSFFCYMLAAFGAPRVRSLNGRGEEERLRREGRERGWSKEVVEEEAVGCVYFAVVDVGKIDERGALRGVSEGCAYH